MNAPEMRKHLEQMLHRCRTSVIPADMIETSLATLAEIADDDLLSLADAVRGVVEDHPDHEDDSDTAYIYGCGEDDTVDSSGQKLRPALNEAGEPWWM